MMQTDRCRLCHRRNVTIALLVVVVVLCHACSGTVAMSPMCKPFSWAGTHPST